MFYLIMKTIAIICLLNITKVQLMSLNGISQTELVPCGLGLLRLEKVGVGEPDEIFWKTEVNLGYYPYLLKADVQIIFDVPVTLFWMSHKSIVPLDNWTFQITDVVPKQFIFIIKLNKPHIIPNIKQFIVNGQVLCQIEDNPQNEQLENGIGSTQYHLCGRRAKEHMGLVTTGINAQRGDWPWHVAVFIKKTNSTQAVYECGGSIISSTAIVTAGHCLSKQGFLTDINKIVIFAGTTNFSQIKDNITQLRKAQQVFLHPSYNDFTATADLAIIKIEPLIFNEHVQPICLWGPAFDKTELFGKVAVFAGFGLTENNTFSNYLRATNLLVQNDIDCVTYSPILYQTLLNEFTFCAGYGPLIGINPRNGDSGGGLMFRIVQPDQKESWFLRGVLSKCRDMTGENVCDPRYYAVFTDIGPHYTWLMHHA